MIRQNGPLNAQVSVAQTAEAERRGAERHPCELQPSWRVLGSAGGESWGASVHDLSKTGISLMLRCWIKPGTVLVVRLHGKGEKLSRPVPVRVMHSTPAEGGEWVIGGMFVRPLHEDELRELVRADEV